MGSETETPDVPSDFGCRICGAQATGFHFEAQSCSACAAFFRRTVALQKVFKCVTNTNGCLVHYSLRQICRACRFRACLAAGMNKFSVQPKKSDLELRRMFCTKSGLKRNKRFSMHLATINNSQSFSNRPNSLNQTNVPNTSTATLKVPPDDSPAQQVSSDEVSPQQSSSSSSHSLPDLLSNRQFSSEFNCPQSDLSTTVMNGCLPQASQLCVRTSSLPTDQKYLFSKCDVLEQLVKEEMKIGERRRILFCERHVASLLGLSRTCPFTFEETRPLRFRTFRKQIRTIILLIYEWLRAWPDYQTFSSVDQITFLRKCVLYHTILDSSFITMQIGYPSRFVMQNGGYVAIPEDSSEGWEDEKEISGETKQRIYRPLLQMLLSEVVGPMLSLKISFEEFVALKAFVSWQGTTCDITLANRGAMRGMLNALCASLHRHYVSNNVEVSERLGSIILLLSSVFATGLQFVESHHEVAFFDLWQLDSLIVEMLKMQPP